MEMTKAIAAEAPSRRVGFDPSDPPVVVMGSPSLAAVMVVSDRFSPANLSPSADEATAPRCTGHRGSLQPGEPPRDDHGDGDQEQQRDQHRAAAAAEPAAEHAAGTLHP